MKRQEAAEEYYWKQWKKNQDQNAADALIRCYEPLVHYHVNRIRVNLPKHIVMDDLYSHGYMGLYDALLKFDIKRDLKFDTYASFRIRGAILDGLRKEDRMPRSLRDKSKKIEAAIERLEQDYMRSVGLDEVADEVGMTVEEVGQVLNEGFLSTILSLDDEARHFDSQEQTGTQIVDQEKDEPEATLLKKESIDQLVEHLINLTKKEQLVISLFYYDELTFTEIGHVMELSTSRVSQIHSKALYKLKKVINQEAFVQ